LRFFHIEDRRNFFSFRENHATAPVLPVLSGNQKNASNISPPPFPSPSERNDRVSSFPQRIAVGVPPPHVNYPVFLPLQVRARLKALLSPPVQRKREGRTDFLEVYVLKEEWRSCLPLSAPERRIGVDRPDVPFSQAVFDRTLERRERYSIRFLGADTNRG